jgi:hypothetical protein
VHSAEDILFVYIVDADASTPFHAEPDGFQLPGGGS